MSTTRSDTLALVHSPVVGPLTWEHVAAALRERGTDVVVPTLEQNVALAEPFWKQHARAAGRALRDVPAESRLVLVGHSGAGLLLPAIREESERSISGYVFVDAGLPKDGETRMGSGPFADYLRALYDGGGRYPDWTEDTLREIPDAELRRRLLAELRPQPRRYWEEPIPVFAGWPDAPCGYVRFAPNPAYDEDAAEARRRGWRYVELAGGHFHMLVQPDAVASAVLDVAADWARDHRPR